MTAFHREAVSNTTYWVDATPPMVLRINEHAPAMDALLSTHGVNEWAFITAFNPGSATHSEEQNSAFNKKLKQLIQGAGLKFLEGHDHSDCNAWPDERSFLILGIKRGAARKIGRQFGQVGIVCGQRGEAPELVYC